MKTILSCLKLFAALALPRIFHAPAEDSKTGTGDPQQRERTPLGGLADGDEKERRIRGAKAAAETLRAQEEKRAKDESRDVQPTPTWEELLEDAGKNTAATPRVPTQGTGEVLNGIYIPTREEVIAAGYGEDKADGIVADVRKEAENAASRRGITTGTERNPNPQVVPTSGAQLEARGAVAQVGPVVDANGVPVGSAPGVVPVVAVTPPPADAQGQSNTPAGPGGKIATGDQPAPDDKKGDGQAQN